MNETNECRIIFAAYNLAIKAKGGLTSMVGLDQLEEVDLRAIWSHETSDFTPWLAKEDNIAILADTLGLDKNKRYILLSGGSMGAGKLIWAIKIIYDMFKNDENREEYSDKLDRILEEADSKIKEKPKKEDK